MPWRAMQKFKVRKGCMLLWGRLLPAGATAPGDMATKGGTGLAPLKIAGELRASEF
jgi:hypothetical protein